MIYGWLKQWHMLGYWVNWEEWCKKNIVPRMKIGNKLKLLNLKNNFNWKIYKKTKGNYVRNIIEKWKLM